MIPTDPPIDADEVERRLVALCLGGGAGLPRRARDLHILLACATLGLRTGDVYDETAVNRHLASWMAEVCPSLGVDVTTLRRLLVDHLYLDRDDSGRHYSPGAGPATPRFAGDVAIVDAVEVSRRARAEREARKVTYSGDLDRWPRTSTSSSA